MTIPRERALIPRFEDHRRHAGELVKAILHAADPEAAVRRHWTPLPPLPTLLLAIGKASRAMATAALELADVPSLRGIVTAPPELAAPLDPRVAVYPCDHPLPTERNIAAARAAVDAIRGMHAHHGSSWQLLLLISGGGSAHLTLPAPPLTLEDLRRLNTELQRAGATIFELNAVRKRTEVLKGGRLGMLVHPARALLMVASDVIGDALDVIASGPVTGDSSTLSEASTVLLRNGSEHHAKVLALLKAIQDGSAEDTPRPDDARLAEVDAKIVLSNSDAVTAARSCAEALGFQAGPVQLGVTGNTRSTAESFARRMPQPLAACVAGGETTVNVGASKGRGGPSQEFALVCALEMERHFDATGVRSVLLAFSTDGVDGPTDAAGAIVSHETCSRLRTAGVDPAAAIDAHDSHGALETVGALLRTGPTGTNVNHVAVLLSYPPEP